MPLPLELAMEVLKYLSPVETNQLRVVSKCYFYLLTSEEVCSFLSHRFITPEYNLTEIHCLWRLCYENNVLRWCSFVAGRPRRIETVGEIDETELKVFSLQTLMPRSNQQGRRLCVSEGFQPLSGKVRSPTNPRPGQITYLVCGSAPFVCGSGNTDGEWLCLKP